jgi:hypothetical protein
MNNNKDEGSKDLAPWQHAYSALGVAPHGTDVRQGTWHDTCLLQDPIPADLHRLVNTNLPENSELNEYIKENIKPY